MESEIAGGERQARWFRQAIDQIRAEQGELDETLTRLDSELDLCFANDDDTLARATIRRKLVARKQHSSAGARLAEFEDQLRSLEAQLVGYRDRLDGYTRKEALLADGLSPAAATTGRGEAIDDTELEIAFLREKQARTPA
jgi:chromosome segregation ATPase